MIKTRGRLKLEEPSDVMQPNTVKVNKNEYLLYFELWQAVLAVCTTNDSTFSMFKFKFNKLVFTSSAEISNRIKNRKNIITWYMK